MPKKTTSKNFVIVRTYSAGVFAGYLKSRDGQEVALEKAIRLWYWKGAASLSELAQSGVKCPDECKFAVPTDVLLLQAIEILPVTDSARQCIESVPSWRA